MTVTRKIIKVITSEGGKTRIVLDDNSEIEGVFNVNTRTNIFGKPSVSLEAYIYPEPKFLYEHAITKKRVELTTLEEARFFDNRDPAPWRRVNVSTE
jgi:hypothetical protein